MMQELKALAHHVILIDSRYLGSSGEGIVTQVHQVYGYQVGIIVLSRGVGTKSRIHALNVEADACLERPVDLGELEAVAWQIYQRLRLISSAVEDTGTWAFYPGSGVLANNNGQRIDLTGSEFRVISALAENCGRVVNKQTLIDIMAPGGATEDTRRLDVLISRLRAKVKSQSGDELSIRTFRNMGYALSNIHVIA